MKSRNYTRIGGLAVVALVSLGLARSAHAVPLAPGDTVALPGSSVAGTVILDDLIAFEIFDGDVLLYAGNLQARVLRLADGRLAFLYLVRDTDGNLNGRITGVEAADFAGFTTDVDSPSVLGDVAPTEATRSTDGSDVLFVFDTSPIFSGDGSEFMYIITDARQYELNGSTTLTLASGSSTAVSTPQPLRDTTPPIAEITEPSENACICDPTTIRGTANDPESGLESYTLEYRRVGTATWTTISTGTSGVVDDVLGVWSTTGLADGFYLLRLTVVNGAGLDSEVTLLVWVGNEFDTVSLRDPNEGDIVGGRVCFDGTVWDNRCFDQYTVEYASAGGGTFQPVDPANPVYTSTVINDPFAEWNTTGLGVADGDYTIRITARDDCGNTKTAGLDLLTVDNTAPEAIITSPSNCDYVHGEVEIVGTANDEHLRSWVLQYTGGDANNWVTFASGNTPVIDDVLAVWDTSGLRPCAYTIRLRVTDDALVNNCDRGHRHATEYKVSVNVGICGQFDLNADGSVGSADWELFRNCVTGPEIPYAGDLPAMCSLTPDAAGILPVDFDGDSDVDQKDFSFFQRCYADGQCIPHLQ